MARAKEEPEQPELKSQAPQSFSGLPRNGSGFNTGNTHLIENGNPMFFIRLRFVRGALPGDQL